MGGILTLLFRSENLLFKRYATRRITSTRDVAYRIAGSLRGLFLVSGAPVDELRS